MANDASVDFILYDGDAFPPGGEKPTEQQVKKQCWLTRKQEDLAVGDHQTERFTTVEENAARSLLLNCRKTIMEKASNRLRSRFLKVMSVQPSKYTGSVEDLAARMHSPRVSLSLCRDIFYSFWTWPFENKDSLYEEVAKEICADMHITFHDKKTLPLECLINVIKGFSLQTVRKSFMISGKHANSKMYLQTRTTKDWTGPIIHPGRQHEFGPHKVGGWDYLVTVDADALKVYRQAHPKAYPQLEARQPKSTAQQTESEASKATTATVSVGSDSKKSVLALGSDSVAKPTWDFPCDDDSFEFALLAEGAGNFAHPQCHARGDSGLAHGAAQNQQAMVLPPNHQFGHGGHGLTRLPPRNNWKQQLGCDPIAFNGASTAPSHVQCQNTETMQNMSEMSGSTEVMCLLPTAMHSIPFFLSDVLLLLFSVQARLFRDMLEKNGETLHETIQETLREQNTAIQKETEVLLARHKAETKELLINTIKVETHGMLTQFLDRISEKERAAENALVVKSNTNSAAMEKARIASKKTRIGGPKRPKPGKVSQCLLTGRSNFLGGLSLTHL
jgi:hypothetical protein